MQYFPQSTATPTPVQNYDRAMYFRHISGSEKEFPRENRLSLLQLTAESFRGKSDFNTTLIGGQTRPPERSLSMGSVAFRYMQGQKPVCSFKPDSCE